MTVAPLLEIPLAGGPVEIRGAIAVDRTAARCAAAPSRRGGPAPDPRRLHARLRVAERRYPARVPLGGDPHRTDRSRDEDDRERDRADAGGDLRTRRRRRRGAEPRIHRRATGSSSRSSGPNAYLVDGEPDTLRVRRRWMPGRRTSNCGCRTRTRWSCSDCARTHRSKPPAPASGRTLAAPRKLDQPRLHRERHRCDLAGRDGPRHRRRADQRRVLRQRRARPADRADHARYACRPDQREDRHQHRERRPDAAAHLPHGGARVPRHHPGRPSDHSPAASCRPSSAVRSKSRPDRPSRIRARTDPWTITAGTVGRRARRQAQPRGDPGRTRADRAGACANSTRPSATSTAWSCTDRTTHELLPLPDNLHPGDDVQALMATRFAERVFGPGGAFSAR